MDFGHSRRMVLSAALADIDNDSRRAVLLVASHVFMIAVLTKTIGLRVFTMGPQIGFDSEVS
jgi:hypothetical protein